MAKNTINKESGKTDISKSKAKREARRKQLEKSRREKAISRIIGWLVTVAILCVIVVFGGKKLYILTIRTTPSSDYSAGLTDDGRIDGVAAGSTLTLADYKNIAIPEDEVAATEEEVNEEIDSALDSYKELNTDPDLAIADGDVVNIDYVGTVDGEEFEGGNSNGAGYDLTIGSGSFVDDFEEQLIGHKPGEDVTVEVTFPDNYSEELAGKDASFAVTINGIMEAPELTDEFVAENLAEDEDVTTVEQYRAKIEDDFRKEHLEEYLTDYVVENSTVNTYPKKYLKSVKATTKNGDNMGTDIDDEIAYEKELTERAQETVKEALVYQAIFEEAGLSVDMDAYYSELVETGGEEYLDNLKDYYGEGYMAQNQIRQTVIDYLVGLYQ